MIIKMSKQMQLARWRVSRFGAGVPGMVVGAATHAFSHAARTVETAVQDYNQQWLDNIMPWWEKYSR